MAAGDRRKDLATAGVGAGLVVGGAHLRERGLRRAVARRGIDRPRIAERALRGGGKGAAGLYAAGALTTAVGATGLVYGAKRSLSKAAPKRTPFLHPKARPFNGGPAAERWSMGRGAQATQSGTMTGAVTGTRSMPFGPRAPKKVLQGLSGRDYGETISRLGRATRRQDKEFSAAVHPISGRVMDMRRGNAHSAGLGGFTVKPNRKSTQRMAELADRAKNPAVRARATNNLQGRNRNMQGPTPVMVHNHPSVHGRSHPSAQDFNAQRQLGGARMAVISHRPGPRGSKQTKLVTARQVDVGNTERAARRRNTAYERIENQDRASQSTAQTRMASNGDRDMLDSLVDMKRDARTRAKRVGGRIEPYDNFVRRNTGGRRGARTGVMTTESFHKADGLLKTGLKGQGDALRSRKEDARDRKRFAQNLAISTVAGMGGALAYGERNPGRPGRANLVGVGVGTLTNAAVTRIRNKRRPVSPSSKATVFEGRNGASKTAFRRGTVPSDQRLAKSLLIAKAQAVTEASNLRRRKRDATLNTIAGAAGIASAGVFGLSQLKTKGAVGRFAVKHKSKLERAAVGTAVGVGGFSGYSTIRGANTQRRLIRQEENERRRGVAKGASRLAALKYGTKQEVRSVNAAQRRHPSQRGRLEPLPKRLRPYTNPESEAALDQLKMRQVGKAMPTGLHVPTGLRQRKTYTASSIRGTATGRLVRVKAGVR